MVRVTRAHTQIEAPRWDFPQTEKARKGGKSTIIHAQMEFPQTLLWFKERGNPISDRHQTLASLTSLKSHSCLKWAPPFVDMARKEVFILDGGANTLHLGQFKATNKPSTIKLYYARFPCYQSKMFRVQNKQRRFLSILCLGDRGDLCELESTGGRRLLRGSPLLVTIE